MTRTELPKRVYVKHGRYYYVTPAGKWIGLSRENDGIPAMLRALARVMDTEVRGDMMPAVITRWVDQKRDDWSTKQAADQERIAGKMAAAMVEFQPSQVTTPVAAAYLRKYRDKPRTHNLHRTMLRGVLAFAAIEGLREGFNPVDNIPPMKLSRRIRIVTDDEIKAMRAAALQQSRNGEALVQMIDLAMLTGQRISDVIKMRWQDVDDARGIYVTQKKSQGRVRLLIEWSPELRAAVEACAAGRDKIGHLLKTQSGRGYRYSGIRSAWVRAAARAGIEDLNIHDLRGRAGVDAMGDDEDIGAAQKLLGHSTEAMTRDYVEGKFAKRAKPAK